MRAHTGTRDSLTVDTAVTHPLDLEVGDSLMDMVDLVAEVSHTVAMAVDTMALLGEVVDSQQEDTVVVQRVDMEVVAVGFHSEDQEDQVEEAHPQEEVSQRDPVEVGTVVEGSHSVDRAVVVEVVAVAHRPLSEGHIPSPHLARTTIHSTANQTSRRTRTTSRLKTGRTGSGVYVTYCMPKEWNRC